MIEELDYVNFNMNLLLFLWIVHGYKLEGCKIMQIITRITSMIWLATLAGKNDDTSEALFKLNNVKYIIADEFVKSNSVVRTLTFFNFPLMHADDEADNEEKNGIDHRHVGQFYSFGFHFSLLCFNVISFSRKPSNFKITRQGSIERKLKQKSDKNLKWQRTDNRLQKLAAYAKLRLKWRPHGLVTSLVMCGEKQLANFSFPLLQNVYAKSQIPLRTVTCSYC